MNMPLHQDPVGSDAVPALAVLAHDALASCHADLLAARQTVLTARDPVGIHGTRVALRRMRAAATLFGRPLADEAILALRADAKLLADACGPTRDLDVFLIGVLKEAEASFADHDAVLHELRSFRAAALRLRRTRHDAARRVLTGDVFTAFDARLASLPAPTEPPPPAEPTVPPPLSAVPGDAVAVSDVPPPMPAPSVPDALGFARDVLRGRDRKLRKGLERFRRLDGAQRHALRLRVKKQRYAASFLSKLFDRKAAGAYIQAAAGMQDALGLANDRLVAAKVIADIRAAARPKGRLDWIAGVLTGWLAGRAQAGGDDDRAVASAGKRFRKAARFWRGGDDGE
ncbi:CHAD domain-containing protein [Vineibacter terrae]|uniref:CHAD domain-containing protein n=2 Tax=Vineibacter terrae TaxID=2586908 RepID=A0A5C8PB74_9HYPH|nr:CHAD domain-containing protein [Vineibacter terrae]